MTVKGTNLAMTRGDSESITVICTSDPFESGDTVTMTLRPDVDEAIALQKVVTEFDGNGAAVIGIAPADTANLTMDMDYVYDIQVVRADGTVTTLIKPSRFTIEEEVTY